MVRIRRHHLDRIVQERELARRPLLESQNLEEGHLRLASDYRDFYDIWFAHRDSDYPIFKRFAQTSRTRIDDLRLLERHGMMVPRYGLIKELAPDLRKRRTNPVIVAHFGEGGRQHRGEGKMVVSVNASQRYLSMAEYSWGDCPGVEYVEQDEGEPPSSFRYLQIGRGEDRIACWFRYESRTDTWRSNVGDVDIRFIRDPRPVGQRSPIDLPTLGLYAVDFVVSKSGLFYAVDYNDAPEIRFTGLEEVIEGEEIYDVIRATYYANIKEWNAR